MALLIGLLIVLGSVAALARVAVRVERISGRWRLLVRYASITLVDTVRTRRRVTHRQHRKVRKRGLPIKRFFEVVPGSIRATWRGLRFLVQHSRIDLLKIRGSLQGVDPAETAMWCGLLSAISGLVANWSSGVDLAVRPEFMNGGSNLVVEAQASARTITLLAFPVIVFLYLPKRALVRFALESARR